MDKVLVTARAESLHDLIMARVGILAEDQVRYVEVDEVVIDPDLVTLAMPKRLIQQLGLQPVRTRRIETNRGTVGAQEYGTVRLTIQGRDCPSDVVEAPGDGPVRIGRVPLLALDLVVDPVGGGLIGNPAHGGEHIIEMY